MSILDETHAPERKSFVATANGHPDFPIQNLPIGIFSRDGGERRSGIAIGDAIFDIGLALQSGLFEGEARAAAKAATGPELNAFLALGAPARTALRRQVSALLAVDCSERPRVEACLHQSSDCTMHLPARISDYTDFYVGIHHATHVGRLFRPDSPLLPNYKHVPIGYHGRASSILASGTAIRRPNGQTKAADTEAPTYGPSRRLDYELEIGVFIGPGNTLGEPIAIGDAAEHIAGFCLLNDWSARDIQAWEYQPLGPFLAKNFASTISPWVISPEALAPFRIAQTPRAEGDPQPLPYLFDERDQQQGAFDLELEALLTTEALFQKELPPHRLALSNTRHMYWTVAQMIAHHASGGCNLQPGDLLGSGTISGPDLASAGSLLEATEGGRSPIRLASGEERLFLEDGDEIIFTARARREGYVTIGFGACRAKVLPALRTLGNSAT
jgi:fumarylacetoacetase